MSRLDDIIELIRTTNEVYFITAPARVRTVYILVDEIIELSLKIFLQEKSHEQRNNCQAVLEAAGLVTSRQHRDNLRLYFEDKRNIDELSNALGRGSPGVPILQGHFASFALIRHWSANDPNADKKFNTVIDDVKPFFIPMAGATLGTSTHPAINLLDKAYIRHKIRNQFYHDHNLSGLDINDEKCLDALCGMFDLMEHLFQNFSNEVKKKHTVRCQIGVLRLKQMALLGQQELNEHYNQALEHISKDHRYDLEPRAIEHSLVHTVSDRFFKALQEQFKNTIAQHQARVDKISNMTRPQQKHRTEKSDTLHLIEILQRQLDRINLLLGTP